MVRVSSAGQRLYTAHKLEQKADEFVAFTVAVRHVTQNFKDSYQRQVCKTFMHRLIAFSAPNLAALVANLAISDQPFIFRVLVGIYSKPTGRLVFREEVPFGEFPFERNNNG